MKAILKSKVIAVTVILMVVLVSCAPEGGSSHEYGFFGGIWHGLIFPFSLIGKLFGGDIGIYADHNTGFTYWFGFVIGLGGLGAGGKSMR